MNRVAPISVSRKTPVSRSPRGSGQLCRIADDAQRSDGNEKPKLPRRRLAGYDPIRVCGGRSLHTKASRLFPKSEPGSLLGNRSLDRAQTDDGARTQLRN